MLFCSKRVQSQFGSVFQKSDTLSNEYNKYRKIKWKWRFGALVMCRWCSFVEKICPRFCRFAAVFPVLWQKINPLSFISSPLSGGRKRWRRLVSVVVCSENAAIWGYLPGVHEGMFIDGWWRNGHCFADGKGSCKRGKWCGWNCPCFRFVSTWFEMRPSRWKDGERIPKLSGWENGCTKYPCSITYCLSRGILLWFRRRHEWERGFCPSCFPKVKVAFSTAGITGLRRFKLFPSIRPKERQSQKKCPFLKIDRLFNERTNKFRPKSLSTGKIQLEIVWRFHQAGPDCVVSTLSVWPHFERVQANKQIDFYGKKNFLLYFVNLTIRNHSNVTTGRKVPQKNIYEGSLKEIYKPTVSIAKFFWVIDSKKGVEDVFTYAFAGTKSNLGERNSPRFTNYFHPLVPILLNKRFEESMVRLMVHLRYVYIAPV